MVTLSSCSFTSHPVGGGDEPIFCLKCWRSLYTLVAGISCRTSTLLSVLEDEGMLFSGRFLVGTAPGASLFFVGTKTKEITNASLSNLVIRNILPFSYLNLNIFLIQEP